MSPNPKQTFGDKKPPLMQLPLAARVHGALALFDGALKYGFRNWRKNKVETLTYCEAIARHLELYTEGEDYTRDTKVHNLGAIIACCAILLDAEVNGALIDNRSPSKAACDLLYQAETIVASLRAMQAQRVLQKAA